MSDRNTQGAAACCGQSSGPDPGADVQVAGLPTSGRIFPLLLLLFFGSGCAALIYEIVWFHMLQLVVGSTAISLGVLLGTFMGGMCLGSLALPRLLSKSLHPLRVWASLEAGIGVSGVLVFLLIPLVTRFYAANALEGLPGLLLRAAVCALCLLPPTLLMGATLPAISRWVETTPKGVSRLGLFYAGNTAGAVCGCLLAGFYLLRVHDVATATFSAVAINAVIAAIGFLLATRTPRKATAFEASPSSTLEAHRAGLVYVTIALSGLCALGAEVVWTRLLSLMLGATVYVFSIILAVFLAGLGLGSTLGAWLARKTPSPRVALGISQMLLTAAIAWSAYMLSESLPYWSISPFLSQNQTFNFQVDFVRCACAILPAAFLWGASFPLALAAAATPGQDPGRLVGRVYAANTAGAIIGSMLCSLVLVAWVGTQQTQRWLIVLSALAGLMVLAPAVWPGRAGSALVGVPVRPGFRIGRAGLLLVATALAGWLAWSVPSVPWKLVAYGRHLALQEDPGRLLYLGEGMNASVAVTEMETGVRNFHVSGKIEASTEPQDMRLQRMLGNIPALLHPQPRSVLVVGCGAGVTAGSFVVHPSITNIVICEIEPLIPKAVATYFGEQNYHVLSDPRLHVIYDDARHYLLRTREKFDIITSDPIHPWVKNAASLYTKEYFELCKQHLSPGGLITQWVPLYETSLPAVKSEFATFFAAFPQGTVWGNDTLGQGYDVVLLGQADSLKVDIAKLRERLEQPDHVRVVQSLRDAGIGSGLGLLLTYAGRGPDLEPWLKDAQINRDGDLRLQYLAGLAFNVYQQREIYSSLAPYRRFPEEIFVGSNVWSRPLRLALDQREVAK
jgi:spermidine synthase